MSTNVSSPARRRWPRRLLIAGACLLALLLVVYFVVTSSAFLRTFVVPRVGASLHADLSVGDIDLRPFSGLRLDNVVLKPRGGRELARIKSVEARHRLGALIAGRIAVRDVVIDSPQIQIHQAADGSGNLSDWLKVLQGPPGGVAESRPTSSEPLTLDIRNVRLKNGAFSLARTLADGTVTTIAVDDLQLEVDQVANGRPAKAALELAVSLARETPGVATNDLLRTAIELAAGTELLDTLMPGEIDAGIVAQVTEASGRFAESQGSGLRFTAKGRPEKLAELSVVFMHGEGETGRIDVSGGIDPSTLDGALDVTFRDVPPLLLDLATMETGFDLDLESLTATNHIELRDGAKQVVAAGQIDAQDVRARGEDGATPALDTALDYALRLDLEGSAVLVDRLQLDIQQDDRPLLLVRSEQPARISWQNGIRSDAGIRLGVRLQELKLSDLAMFTGPWPLDGFLGAQITLASQDAGQQMRLDGELHFGNGTLDQATGRIDGLELNTRLRAQFLDFAHINLEELQLSAAHSNSPIAMLTLSGTIEPNEPNASLTTGLTLHAAPLLRAWHGDTPALTEGQVIFTSVLNYAPGGADLRGTLSATNVSGVAGGAVLQQLGVATGVDVTLAGSVAKWNLESGSIQESNRAAGGFRCFGELNLHSHTGRIELAVTELNSVFPNIALAALVPDRRLTAGMMNLMATGELGSNGWQHWRSELVATNFSFVSTNGAAVGEPLSERAVVDVEFHPAERLVRLKECEVVLYAGGAPAGRFEASGDLAPGEGRAQLKATLSGLNEKVLHVIAPLVLGDRKLDAVGIDGHADVDYHADRPSHLRAGLLIDKLAISDTSGSYPIDPRFLEFALDSSILSNRLEIARGHLQLAPTSKATNVIDLGGWLDFKRLEAIDGEVSVTSPGLDLTPLAALLERDVGKPGPTNSPALPADDVRAAVGSAESRDKLTILPIGTLKAELNLAAVHLRELVVTNWIGNAIIKSNAVRLDPFSLSLNGAPVNASLVASHDNSRFQFDLGLEVEHLPVSPVVRSFVPNWNGLAEADLFVATDINGSGAAGDGLWEQATGHAYLALTNANLQVLGGGWQAALRPVGLALQTPELFSSPINWFLQHLELTPGKIDLRQLTIMSEIYVADLTATFALADEFASTPVPDTPLDLYLSRNLVTQMKLLSGNDTNHPSRYVRLPQFATIRGTIGKPIVEVDKLKLAGTVIGKAGDFVGGSAGGILQKTGSLTEGIGGVLSGRALGSESTNKPGLYQKGVEGVFNAVGGLFGGAAKAVDTGTSTLTQMKTSDIMASRLRDFDWPRRFTKAPNMATEAVPATPITDTDGSTSSSIISP